MKLIVKFTIVLLVFLVSCRTIPYDDNIGGKDLESRQIVSLKINILEVEYENKINQNDAIDENNLGEAGNSLFSISESTRYTDTNNEISSYTQTIDSFTLADIKEISGDPEYSEYFASSDGPPKKGNYLPVGSHVTILAYRYIIDDDSLFPIPTRIDFVVGGPAISLDLLVGTYRIFVISLGTKKKIELENENEGLENLKILLEGQTNDALFFYRSIKLTTSGYGIGTSRDNMLNIVLKRSTGINIVLDVGELEKPSTFEEPSILSVEKWN